MEKQIGRPGQHADDGDILRDHAYQGSVAADILVAAITEFTVLHAVVLTSQLPPPPSPSAGGRPHHEDSEQTTLTA